MAPYRENRWFTVTGKRKRVPAALEPYRLAIILSRRNISNNPEVAGSIDTIELTKQLRNEFNLGLADAYNLAIYLHGIYDNHSLAKQKNRFDAGEVIHELLRISDFKPIISTSTRTESI